MSAGDRVEEGTVKPVTGVGEYQHDAMCAQGNKEWTYSHGDEAGRAGDEDKGTGSDSGHLDDGGWSVCKLAKRV